MRPSETVRLRRRQLVAAAPALARAVRWQPVPVAGLLAAALLRWRAPDLDDPAAAVWLLRAVALLLAAAVPFALDDRSRTTLAASPTPLSSRTAGVLLVVTVPAALVWVAACAWVAGRTAVALPAGALTVEAVGLVSTTVGLALVLARWRDLTDPGAAVAPVVVGLGLLLPRLPTWATLTPLPGPDWSAAHQRWGLAAAVALVVCAAAVADPGRRRRPLGVLASPRLQHD